MSTRIGKNDAHILAALSSVPTWLHSKVLVRLAGWPNPEPCWIWEGSRSRGHSTVRLPGAIAPSPVYVHRVVWLALRGPIASGHVLDHDGPNGCKNKACANPAHLMPVTEFVNSAVTGDGPGAKNARKTHCPKGHPLSGENLVAAAARRGGRNCRACQLEGSRRQSAAIMLAARTLGMTRRQYVATHGKSTAVAIRLAGGEAA